MKQFGAISILSFLLLSCQVSHRHSDENVTQTTDSHSVAWYHTQLGLAYLKQGDRARAKAQLLVALAEDPNAASTNAAMAYLMDIMGEHDKARSFYQKAMRVASERGAHWNNYGAFLCRQGDYPQADVYFRKAATDFHYPYTAMAYENAGLCALLGSDVKKARGYFKKALAQDPSRQQSLHELAKLRSKT